ncbi:MAG TPA: winged helix-turn-helix domain-containing protein, partial [Polyangiaceae bacterium LLY-WYZ-14_1]|nr:winged helix-turn-helix domain-containing protein [Polyangiaceae bacterium LLY-WYZ-14_1]
LRAAVLAQLQQAEGSASEVAERLGESRQRVGYHVRELERAGLLDLVATRQRRGFEERVLRATARAVVPEPVVLGSLSPAETAEAFAAETLVALTARSASEVSRMKTSAAEAKKRLLTFAIETEIAFRRPADVEAFTEHLARALGELVARYQEPGGRRRYRIIVGGHPRPKNDAEQGDGFGSPGAHPTRTRTRKGKGAEHRRAPRATSRRGVQS